MGHQKVGHKIPELEQIAKNTESIKRGIWVLVIVFVVIPIISEGCKELRWVSTRLPKS